MTIFRKYCLVRSLWRMEAWFQKVLWNTNLYFFLWHFPVMKRFTLPCASIRYLYRPKAESLHKLKALNLWIRIITFYVINLFSQLLIEATQSELMHTGMAPSSAAGRSFFSLYLRLGSDPVLILTCITKPQQNIHWIVKQELDLEPHNATPPGWEKDPAYILDGATNPWTG